MIIKIFIIASFLLILASLASALYHLVKHKDQPEKTVKALTYRISLSLLLFILIFLAFAIGLIKPGGLSVKIHPPKTDTPQFSPQESL